jgi:hypothetical protein
VKLFIVLSIFSFEMLHAKTCNPSSQPTSLTNSMLNMSRSIIGITFPKGHNVCSLKTNGRDIRAVNFKSTSGLTIEMLNESKVISYIKLPKDFDVTFLKTTARDLSGIDFSLTKGLTVKHLNKASSISYVVLPDRFNVSKLKFNKRNINGINFTKTNGLTGYKLSLASSIRDIQLPAKFNWSGFNSTHLSLDNIDLSDSVNFSVKMLNQSKSSAMVNLPADLDLTQYKPNSLHFIATDFSKIKNIPLTIFGSVLNPIFTSLPVMDLQGLSFDSIDLHGFDLTLAQNLRKDALDKAINIPAAFPSGFDISSLSTKDMAIDFTDFSNVKGFSAKHVNQAETIYQVRFPDNFSTDALDLSGKNLFGNSFENLPSFNCKHLNQTTGRIAYSKIPEKFDSSCLDFKKVWHGFDFSMTIGLTARRLSDAIELDSCQFPKGFDFSGFDAKGTRIVKMDLSGVKNLTVKMLEEARAIVGLKLPNIDLSDFSAKNKNLWKIDFSLVENLKLKTLQEASSLSQVKFPNNFDLSGFIPRGQDLSYIDFSNIK